MTQTPSVPKQRPVPNDQSAGQKRRRPKPGPLAARRNPKSHLAVLRAAEELLADSGYSSITVDQIAQRSGVSKATIYRWWPNRAAIFMELYGNLAAQLQQPVDTGSLEGDLREQIRSAFKLFRTTVAGVALAGFVADGQSNPAIADMLRGTFADRRRKLNRALVDRAVARGEVGADLSVDVGCDVITGAVYYGLLIGPPVFTEERADQIVRVILAGIAIRPPPCEAEGTGSLP